MTSSCACVCVVWRRKTILERGGSRPNGYVCVCVCSGVVVVLSIDILFFFRCFFASIFHLCIHYFNLTFCFFGYLGDTFCVLVSNPFARSTCYVWALSAFFHYWSNCFVLRFHSASVFFFYYATFCSKVRVSFVFL